MTETKLMGTKQGSWSETRENQFCIADTSIIHHCHLNCPVTEHYQCHTEPRSLYSGIQEFLG